MTQFKKIKANSRFQRLTALLSCLAIALILVFLQIRPTDIVAYTQQLYSKAMKFNMVLDKIARFYVDERHAAELVEDAIKGMLHDLDPFTVYLSAEDYSRYKKEMDGYFGIGVKYDLIDDQYIIISVVNNSPAFNSGLQQGDRILSIDGIPAEKLRYGEVTYRLHGPPDTKVRLQIIRHGWNEPREYNIPCLQIVAESIPCSFIIRPGIGFIKISRFTPTTAQELDVAFAQLRSDGMQNLIIDLRDNTGGTLLGAESVADRFISGGKIIVYTKGRTTSSTQRYVATDISSLPQCPLIILVNGISASGSEIVAGAVQDWDRGLIVGETTFGKALVQSEFPFQDGSALLLTTARYYTPLGRMIQRDYEMDANVRQSTVDTVAVSKRPVYTTPSGRAVYGGGGITPDVIVPSEHRELSPAMRQLYTANERFFFTFADDYQSAHPDISGDIATFVNEFRVSDILFRQFTQKVLSSATDISQAALSQNVSEIKYLIKQELARRIWGDQGAYQVAYSTDTQVLQAINHMEEAAALILQ